jgi:predicted nucleotidyltransferase
MTRAAEPSPFSDQVTKAVLAWALGQDAVRGLALVGSYARGTARADSDIDLMLLVRDPSAFRADSTWLGSIAWDAIALPARWQDEEYGAAWSRRVWLNPAGEVEFTFAMPSWAATAPIDPGTRRVISDGCKILHDPDGALSRLCIAVKATSGLPSSSP